MVKHSVNYLHKHHFIHSFIHSFMPFYSASSSPLPLRSASDTARILCWSFTPKQHRQLRVKDLPKDPTWRLERDSNPRPFCQRLGLYQCATTSKTVVSNRP